MEHLSSSPAIAGPTPNGIRVKHLSKRFGPQQILRDVNLEISHGEVVVALGPSGSGKTTLLRIIAGLEAPDEGEVHIRGSLATNLPPQQRGLGVVFQEHALFQRKTVEENIGFGLQMQGKSRDERQSAVSRLLTLTQLESHRKKYPSQLSGGQRQRVALARALAFEPEALLFDEAFSALDAITRVELRREVRAILRAMNVPALFITHDQEEALELADRIVVLNEGQIVQEGTPFEVYNHPCNEFVATFLGAANVLLGRWSQGKVTLGRLRLKATTNAPMLAERQAVKVVFRPEDVVLNFQPQLLDTPYYLGRAEVEDISYIGHSERLILRLLLWSPQGNEDDPEVHRLRNLALVDETYAEGFPIVITRNKWEATEMELSVGDAVVVGLKGYRLLPHYPLGVETGAKVFG
ncbi:MAG: ABC transporter ATP-binding protein [Acidobacteria bacterium]|nr:ABC transporter ATP-binding protein [Acidobacteriota bacterium]